MNEDAAVRHEELLPVWRETSAALTRVMASLRQENESCDFGFAKHFLDHNENELAYSEIVCAIEQDCLKFGNEISAAMKLSADLMELRDQERFGF